MPAAGLEQYRSVAIFIGMALSLDQFQKIMPRMTRNPLDSKRFLPLLNQAMDEFGVSSHARQAAFLAQIAHESGELRYWEEIWGPSDAQKRYEPPSTLATRLGNLHAGDGFKYRGRGPIQITGRDNYSKYGKALALDLLGNPDQASHPEVGFRIAGSYWSTHGLNELADAGDFDAITKRINGGFNGKPSRDAFYATAKSALGA